MSDQNSHFDEFVIAGEIDKILSKYSAPQRKKVLNLLAAKEKSRLVPFGVPVGAIAPTTSVESKSLKRNGAAQSGKISWKQDPHWKEISSRRDAIVSELKTLQDDNPRKVQCISSLRSIEREMKRLKDSLRNPAGSSR